MNLVKKLLLTIVAALTMAGLSIPTQAQTTAPDTVWTRNYSNSDSDKARDVQQTTDGGYVLVGTTALGAPNTGTNLYLIKTDAQGNRQWEKYLGADSGEDGYAVRQTSDGGYILAGRTYSYGSGQADVYIVKTDQAGNPVWTRNYGGDLADEAHSIELTNDGGYILTGFTYKPGAGTSDIYLIKIDANGNKIWEKAFGGDSNEDAWSVQQTSDGGYILAGITESASLMQAASNMVDMYLIKTDGNGNKQWEKTFGGSYPDYAFSIRQTNDGGYVIAGQTASFGVTSNNVYVIKTDGMGNKQWDRNFGGNEGDYSYSVKQTKDGGYIIGGQTYSGLSSLYIIKLAASGNKEWEKTIASLQGSIYSILQSTDGGFVATGNTFVYDSNLKKYFSNVFLVKLNGEGFEQEIQVKWPRVYDEAWPDPTDDRPIICEIRVRKPDGEVVYKGKTKVSGKLLVKGLRPGDVIQAEQVGFPDQARGEFTVPQTAPLPEALNIPISPAFMSPKLN